MTTPRTTDTTVLLQARIRRLEQQLRQREQRIQLLEESREHAIRLAAWGGRRPRDPSQITSERSELER